MFEEVAFLVALMYLVMMFMSVEQLGVLFGFLKDCFGAVANKIRKLI
jgi:hypothetical protein